MLKKFLYTFTSILTISFTTFAQDGAPQQDQSEPAVSVNLHLYRWTFSNAMTVSSMITGVSSRTAKASSDDQADQIYWYYSGNKWNQLRISAGEKTKEISYSGPRTMRLYSKIEGPVKEGELPYKEACSLSLPTNASDLFVLMFMRGKTVRFYPMNVSPTSLPKGQVAVLNMTNQNIAVAVDKEVKRLNSGTNLTFKPKVKDDGQIDLKLARFDPKQKKWREVYDNSLTAAKEKRTIMLIYDPENKKSPRFMIQTLIL